MLRKVLSGVVILTICVSFTLADEISAIIYKVADDKVTFKEAPKGRDGEAGPEKTLPVAKDVKIVEGKRGETRGKLDAGEAIAKGLKDERFSKIDEKGLRGMIITDKDNKTITEIRVAPPRGAGFGGDGKGFPGGDGKGKFKGKGM